jgi:HEAT repeat protein
LTAAPDLGITNGPRWRAAGENDLEDHMTSALNWRLAAAIAATLALSVACDSGPKPGEEANYYGEKLFKGDRAKRNAAMTHLAKLKDKKALPHLLKVLQTEELKFLRPAAVEQIGNLGDTSHIAPLVEIIDWRAGAGRDKESRANAQVNERIAKALGKLATPDHAQAITTLKRMAGSNHQNTQLAAIFALGELGAKDAADDLILVADGSPNNFLVKHAAIALGKIGDEKAVPVLTKLLFFERQGVSFYREASYALFQIGKPATPKLIETYQGKNTDLESMHLDQNVLRAKVIEVMTDIGDERVLPMITETAQISVVDPFSGAARAKAHRALGIMGVKKSVPVLLKYWDDVIMDKSMFALRALERIGEKSVIPALHKMSTLEGFMKQCTKDFGNSEEVCKNSQADVRAPRLESLSRLGGADMLAEFEKMEAAEADAKLKKKIGEYKPRLVAAKACDGKGKDCWVNMLKDKDPKKREKAAYELLWLQDQSTKDALGAALRDEDNETRYAVILALWRMMPKDAKKLAGDVRKQIEEEKGKTQFVRINEDLKRLEIKLARGY